LPRADPADEEEKAREGPGATVRSARREACARYIAAHGPTRQTVLCAECKVPTGSIRALLEHPWFEREGDGWHITQQARIDVIDKERP
jgi:hypothetical protein